MVSRELDMLSVPAAFQGVLDRWLEFRGVTERDNPLSSSELRRGSIKWSEWIRMIHSAAARVGGPVSGLEIGAMVTFRDLGPIAYLALQGRNFGGVLETYFSLSKLFYGHNWGELVSKGERVQLVWRSPDTVDPLAEQINLTAAVMYIRALIPGGFNPVCASVTADELGDPEMYRQAWGCDVMYSAPQAMLEYRQDMLEIPIDFSRFGMLQPAATGNEPVDLELLEGVETVAEVWTELMRQMPAGNLGIEKVAKSMGTSPRSLQRRLWEQNLSFRQVLDAARQHWGKQLLGNRALSVKQIAHMLGYGHTSAFTHAYSRWYGRSPIQERNIKLLG